MSNIFKSSTNEELTKNDISSQKSDDRSKSERMEIALMSSQEYQHSAKDNNIYTLPSKVNRPNRQMFPSVLETETLENMIGSIECRLKDIHIPFDSAEQPVRPKESSVKIDGNNQVMLITDKDILPTTQQPIIPSAELSRSTASVQDMPLQQNNNRSYVLQEIDDLINKLNQ